MKTYYYKINIEIYNSLFGIHKINYLTECEILLKK